MAIIFIIHRRAVVKQVPYNTFVWLCKHCFVMQPLQNQPLCSSTVFTYFRIQWFGSTTIDAYCELYIVEFLQSQMSLIAFIASIKPLHVNLLSSIISLKLGEY
jgi:hypothetical protein